jgi:hypothetical protein
LWPLKAGYLLIDLGSQKITSLISTVRNLSQVRHKILTRTFTPRAGLNHYVNSRYRALKQLHEGHCEQGRDFVQRSFFRLMPFALLATFNGLASGG